MIEQLEQVRVDALQEISRADSLKLVEELRVKFLGRKGVLTGLLRSVSQASPEERPVLGKAANELKLQLTASLDQKFDDLQAIEKSRTARNDFFDVTLPGRRPRLGHLHVISQVAEEIVAIFAELGFQVATGPEIETEYYNFDALNTPPDHPARDLHDTFFVRPGVVLRTHTSPVQMRVMEKMQPPVAVVAPGRVYRVDADATHSPMFFQIEGLLVDEGVGFADLKGTLMHFIHRLFGKDVQMRFRPHFFPFTEPSAELDILWTSDKGGGGSQTKWMEILGCGMVHPEVFKHAGYDPERYTGFAFGLGVDRIAMVRHRISSITYLYESDMRFLEQF
ncbi:MAG: phenylalanine--tRNA ligase subunit alpha [Candidatus Hydrogenedentes bacterium]|nr:phenylalanine--tRNA ligase subunit alpha [Candidatus Hydrogenedentota bacterium]